MVVFLQKSYGNEEFHPIVDFLADSHIRYTLTANPTIYASLIEQFWQTATVETVNNGEQQLSVTVDGQTISINEASVRRHLQLADADGISSLPSTKIFEQLTLMGYVSNDDKLTFQKGPSSLGGTQHTSTLIKTSPQLQNISNLYRKTRTRTRRMGIRIPQFDVSSSVVDEAIIKEMHDGLVRTTTNASSLEAEQGSGNIAKTQTKATSSGPSSPRTSLEGGPGTKAAYNKALITLTKRVKKLEKQLKHKRRRTVIDSSEDEEPSLDAEDSPKQGRMIKEIDNDEIVNLNIKRSAAKGKAIMQESKPPKKIKKKEMIQISLDEEFAKIFYEEEQAQILQDEIYAKQVEAQWTADEERIPQEAKQTNEREKVINWNDPDVLRYHAVQNRPFSKAELRKNMCTYLKNQGGYKMSHFKRMIYEDIRPIFERVWDQNQAFVPKDSEFEKEVINRPGFDLQQESSKKTGESRKKTLASKRAGEKQSKEGAKRQKIEYEKEKEKLKAYLDLVPREEFAMEIESLGTKNMLFTNLCLSCFGHGHLDVSHVINELCKPDIVYMNGFSFDLAEEGSMQLFELINLCTKFSYKVTSLEDEFASTKAVYNKALITLTKKVKKLEKQLKHKRRRTVIDSSEDEGPSLDAEDSPKQGRMIKEIDNDETVNLFKSIELEKSHDTVEHRMESEHDDDDRTLAETLLNIKRSAAKGYKMSHFKGMSYEDIRPIFERVWDQNQDFVPKDSEIEKEVMKRPGFDLQQESSKKVGGSRKKTLARKKAGEKQSKECAKRQKTEYENEKEELKAYLDLVPREEFAMEIESLDTKYPIVDWKTHVLTENFMYYQIIRTDGGSKNYKIFGEILDDFDRQDVMDLHILVEERYATSRPEGYDLMLWGDRKILFQPDEEDEVWREEVSTYSRNAIKDVKQKTRG
ncbi:hypothetical protein Tco_0162207 [Tanacetum coccineum]